MASRENLGFEWNRIWRSGWIRSKRVRAIRRKIVTFANWGIIQKYIIALFSLVVATLVRMMVDPIVGEMHPFVTYIFATIFCAWYCGLGPSIMTMVLGFLLAGYFFASPRGSVAMHGVDVQVGLVLYVFLSISSIWFSELMHRANRRAEATSKQLLLHQAELEHEVLLRKSAEEETVALLRRSVHLQEDERLRISRELHDQCGQDLVALQLGIQRAVQRLRNNRPSECEAVLKEVNQTLEGLGRELHTLAFELRPPSLDELGLKTAIESLLSLWSRRCGISVDFECRNWDTYRIRPEVSVTLYRVLQEGLNNVAKHSGSRDVSVILEMQEHQIVLILEDYGSGMKWGEDGIPTAIETYGLGIHGMEERMKAIGGSLEIESTIDQGTTIFARVSI
ncbi:MAG: sensor histidine kinase [Planctomycetes bacterium]|nr:sensor histidine kinase [Planctomycetota bacterium]